MSVQFSSVPGVGQTVAGGDKGQEWRYEQRVRASGLACHEGSPVKAFIRETDDRLRCALKGMRRLDASLVHSGRGPRDCASFAIHQIAFSHKRRTNPAIAAFVSRGASDIGKWPTPEMTV